MTRSIVIPMRLERATRAGLWGLRGLRCPCGCLRSPCFGVRGNGMASGFRYGMRLPNVTVCQGVTVCIGAGFHERCCNVFMVNPRVIESMDSRSAATVNWPK